MMPTVAPWRASALAGRDGDDVLHARQPRVVGAVGAAADLGGDLHVDAGDPRDASHRLLDGAHDLVPRRADRGGQLDADLGAVTGELDGRDHPRREEVDLQGRILDLSESGLDGFLGFFGGRNARSLPNLRAQR
jgi:hypothetical protein